MKKINDDDIQRLLEKGINETDPRLSAAEKEDIEAYRFLFKTLSAEPKAGLPYNFAAKVSRRIQAKANRVNDIRLYLLAGFLGIAGFVIAYGLLVFYNRNTATQFLAAVAEYKWAFVLALVSFLTIQYLDQKLIREQR